MVGMLGEMRLFSKPNPNHILVPLMSIFSSHVDSSRVRQGPEE